MTVDHAAPNSTSLPPGGADKSAGPGHDDGLLDSIGKAVAAPIEGAAEADETAMDAPRRPLAPS